MTTHPLLGTAPRPHPPAGAAQPSFPAPGAVCERTRGARSDPWDGPPEPPAEPVRRLKPTATPNTWRRRRAPGGRGIPLPAAPPTPHAHPSPTFVRPSNFQPQHMSAKHTSSVMKTNTPTASARASTRTAAAAATRVTRRAPGWPYCLQPGRPNYAFGPLNNSELPFYVHLPRPANRASSLCSEQRLNAAPPL